MTLASLAQTTDLPSQWQGNAQTQRALDLASAAIREAAGSAISQQTSTITVVGSNNRLLRVPGPIQSVASIVIGDLPALVLGTDFFVLPEGLYRRCGWLDEHWEMSPIVITYTWGYVDVPLDIVDMCATLATTWLVNQTAGTGSQAGITQIRLDDAQESYTEEYASSISAIFIPKATADWLAARFGGGAQVAEML